MRSSRVIYSGPNIACKTHAVQNGLYFQHLPPGQDTITHNKLTNEKLAAQRNSENGEGEDLRQFGNLFKWKCVLFGLSQLRHCEETMGDNIHCYNNARL